MRSSKTQVQSVDLDELERQLREVAVASGPKKADDPLAELARIVEQDKRARLAPAARAPSLANGAAQAMPTGHDAQHEAEPYGDEEYAGEDYVDEAQEPGFPEEMSFEEAGEPVEAYAEHYSEAWEEGAPHAGAMHFGAVGSEEFAGGDEDAVMPGAEAARERRLMSPRAVALAVPLVLIAVGVGAAMVLHRGHPLTLALASGDVPVIKADTAPVKVLPDKAASQDQTSSQAALGAADASGAPSQITVADPEQPVDVVAAAKSAQARDAKVTQPPPSTGIVILSGSGQPSSSQPQSAAPAGNDTAAAAPQLGADTAGPAKATAAADVPLPQPPQPSDQGSAFGAPHRVSTLSVKPDGTMSGGGKPKADATANATPAPRATMMAQADAPLPPTQADSTTPAPKKTADTTRTRPKPKAGETAARAVQEGGSGAPLSITPTARGRTMVASAAPMQGSEPQAPAETNASATREAPFAVQFASSPSESDARATLARLKRQFPNALGSASVRRADLGAKGIYYRVRVGPLTREAGQKICTEVKAGGAECILTRG